MDFELGDAFEFSDQEPDLEDESLGVPKILVIGCGGAGNNTINRLISIGLEGAEAIAINTDSQHLGLIEADKKIHEPGRCVLHAGRRGKP